MGANCGFGRKPAYAYVLYHATAQSDRKKGTCQAIYVHTYVHTQTSCLIVKFRYVTTNENVCNSTALTIDAEATAQPTYSNIMARSPERCSFTTPRAQLSQHSWHNPIGTAQLVQHTWHTWHSTVGTAHLACLLSINFAYVATKNIELSSSSHVAQPSWLLQDTLHDFFLHTAFLRSTSHPVRLLIKEGLHAFGAHFPSVCIAI